MKMAPKSKRTLLWIISTTIIGLALVDWLLVATLTTESEGNTPNSSSSSSAAATPAEHDDSFSWWWTCLWVGLVAVALLHMRRKVASFGRSGSNYTRSENSFVLPAGQRASQLSYQDREALAIQGPTLVFDGVCHLCNGSMKWFSERSQHSQVWYMWCQHEDAQSLMAEFGISRDDLLRSWAFLYDGVVYRGSTAWLMAVRHLNRPWCFMHYFIYVPLWIREAVYGHVARNRYRYLGKSEVCERPNKFMISRMLHSLSVPPEGEQDKDKALVIPKETRKRLLVIGCGPAGMMIAKKMRHAYNVLVVEPKDYYEFTPGILRGMCDPDQLQKLHCPLSTVFTEHMGITWIQGVVSRLESCRATLQCHSPLSQQQDRGKLSRFLVTGSETKTTEIEFDYCVIASGSAYVTSPLWKVFPSPSPTKNASQFSLSDRVAQMTAEHEKLAQLNSQTSTPKHQSKHSIAIVGAGLVGVELAAELCIHYPNLGSCITLYDLAPHVLPLFPQRARDYASQWLTKRGVVIATNSTKEEVEAAKTKASVVYMCVGVKVTAGSFMPASTIDERGEIAVNEACQVVKVNNYETELGLKHVESSLSTNSIVATPSTLFGSGRIFAVGDCVRVQGLPSFQKDTYPAEAQAGVVTKNLIRSLNKHCTLDRHAKIHMNTIHPLQEVSLCSLGPHDCIMVVNGMYIANGRLASFLKDTIEYTKMSEARNEFLGTSLWSVIPHF